VTKINICDNCILIHYVNEKITAISDVRKTSGGTIVFGVPQSVKVKVSQSGTEGILGGINETRTDAPGESPKKTDHILVGGCNNGPEQGRIDGPSSGIPNGEGQKFAQVSFQYKKIDRRLNLICWVEVGRRRRRRRGKTSETPQ
jgi:hypothetical protein